MRFKMGKLVAAAAMGLAGMMVGCSSTDGMSRHDVAVSLAPELAAPGVTAPSVRVDIVAVNSTEAARWENYSMTDYWSKPDSLRTGADRHEMAFGPGNTAPKTLSKSDPLWEKWGAPSPSQKSGMQLFILADLPGSHQDLPGVQDDRRIVLPLDESRWNGEQPIRITVLGSRLKCETPPLEPKPKK